MDLGCGSEEHLTLCAECGLQLIDTSDMSAHKCCRPKGKHTSLTITYRYSQYRQVLVHLSLL